MEKPIQRAEFLVYLNYMKTLLLFTLRWLGIFIELVLVLRVGFRLFGANPQASFMQFIADLSGTLVNPFEQIFPAIGFGAKYLIDTPALVAMFIYALGYIILYRAISGLFLIAEDKPEKKD